MGFPVERLDEGCRAAVRAPDAYRGLIRLLRTLVERLYEAQVSSALACRGVRWGARRRASAEARGPHRGAPRSSAPEAQLEPVQKIFTSHDLAGRLANWVDYLLTMTDRQGVLGVEAANAALGRGLGNADLLVLPRESSESGIALYDDSVIGVVKALKSEGYEAAFADDAEHRSWVGEKSAEVVIALIVGVGSNAAWSGLVWLFRKLHADRRVEAKIARIERGTDNSSWEWGEFKGTGADVAGLIEKWRDKPSGE